ncbi:hypothetical protein BpHYR1_052325 [Brachionus plicatilis]|uniref:Uncharacterized protein n=1 Tax=Brachionus plicatilis TaxID=10195 RepID=A0A3M7T354_BRAPC|nr:hypothetical protein BpHYR1_052325 [Brachionus plicatilis]
MYYRYFECNSILLVRSANFDRILKLAFSISLDVNKKLFSISRLFYLTTSVKIQMKLNKNDSMNLKYNLRNSENLIEPMSKTAIGEKIFEYFYTKLMNSFVFKRSMLKFATFKLYDL